MIAHPGISGIIYRRTPPLRKNPQNLGYNWGFWGTMPQLLEDSNEALALLAATAVSYRRSVTGQSMSNVDWLELQIRTKEKDKERKEELTMS